MAKTVTVDYHGDITLTLSKQNDQFHLDIYAGEDHISYPVPDEALHYLFQEMLVEERLTDCDECAPLGQEDETLRNVQQAIINYQEEYNE